MRKFLLFIIALLISNALYAESSMSLYKDNYFAFGDSEDQVKFQVSAKYNVFFPSTTGIYLGYTQICWWKLYDSSAPFYETNYMPEGFYKLENNNNVFGLNMGYIDYIQVSPIAHCSNGKDGLNSRSINTYYGQIQLSIGEVYNLGVNAKIFDYYNVSSKNKDYNDYKNNYEGTVFFKVKSATVEYLDKEELSCRFSGTPWDKGFYEVTGSFRLVTSVFQPRLFIQYYAGYGEFMINYDKKDTAVRAGLSFID